MNSKEALENIAIEFDNMGMICSNIGYKDFWEKDLHFKEIFKYEYKVISQALDKLKQLEKENKELRKEKDFAWEKSKENWVRYQKECEDVSELLLCIEKKNEELIRYEKALDILKEYNLKVMFNEITDKTPYILFNPECDGCVVITQEEYELLKEVLEEE